MLVIRTKKGDPEVFIPALGQLQADAKGGIPVDDAAQALSELQDEKGKPLTGGKLKDAAQAFAEDRGWETAEIAAAEARSEEPAAPANQEEK